MDLDYNESLPPVNATTSSKSKFLDRLITAGREKIFGRQKGDKDEEEEYILSTKFPTDHQRSTIPANYPSPSISPRFLGHRTSMYSLDSDLETSDTDEYTGMDTSRNIFVTSANLFRKGPMPIESLKHCEQTRLSTLGCLKEWTDIERKAPGVYDGFEEEKIASKSFLSYFAR